MASPTNQKLNVAVVCGGNSGEFDISVESGKVVQASLDSHKYCAFLLIIKGTSWKYIDRSGEAFPVNKDDFSIQKGEEKIQFDVVFNAIHGTPGEDGMFTGYLDMLQIPYTSSNHVVSAATFNKNICKQLVQTSGVALAKSVLLHKGDQLDAELIVQHLGLPLFVKPNSGGSSVGVSKVTAIDLLPDAIAKAFEEDEDILVESFISGREMGCGVFEYKGRLMVFPVTEIISKKEFFDYEAKYTKGMSDEITPAQIEENEDMEIKAMAAMLYKHIGCKGFVRFDFIMTDHDIYFLEVNTVPGMTAASILPQQAEVMGISLKDLFDMAVENALFIASKGK
jgi:D-alanine-D-alanine ligase